MFNRKICYLLLILIHCIFVFSRTSTPTHSPTASPQPRSTDCVLLAGGKYIQTSYDINSTPYQKYGILGYNTTTKQILEPKKSDSFLPKGVYSNGVIDNFITSNSSLIFAGKFQKVKNEYSNSVAFANLEKLNNQTTVSGMSSGVWNVGYKIPTPDTLHWPSLFFTNWMNGKYVVAGPFTVVESIGNNLQGLAIYDETTTWSAFPNTYQLCSNCQIISVASSEENLFAVTMSTLSNFQTELYSFSVSSSTWHQFESLVTPEEDQNKLLRIAVNTLTLNDDSSFLFAIGYSSSVTSPSIYDPVLNFYLLSWDTSSLSSPNITKIWEKDCTGEENIITFPKITKITGSNDVAVTIPYQPCSLQMTTFKRFTGVDDQYNNNDNAFIPINTLNSIDFLVSTEVEGELFISDTQTIYHLFSGHWVSLNIGVDQLDYSNDYEITALTYNYEYSRLYVAIRYLLNNETSVLYWPYHNWENLLFSAEVFQSGSISSLLPVHNNTQVMMGGEFQYIDHVKVNSIALWNGTNWIDQGINERMIVNSIAELDGVIYALAYDPLDDTFNYGSSFPIYYLDNNEGNWKLMPNAPVINIPYGQSSSFNMKNTRALFAHAPSHSLFIGGNFYVLLNNGQTAKGLMEYSSETKQWSNFEIEFDQINAITVLDDEVLEVGGKFSVVVNSVTCSNFAAYNLMYKTWTSPQSTSLQIQSLVPYKKYTSIAGGSHAQTSSVNYYDFYYNHWSSAPVLADTTFSVSLLGDVLYAGGSYGVSKLDRNASKWSAITSTLFQGEVYSTLILCNATSFIPLNTTTDGNDQNDNGDNSSDFTSIYLIDCDDPQYKDTKECEVSQSNASGGMSIWGIVGLIAAILFTIVVVGVIGFLFYLQKVKKMEEEVEYI